MGTLADSLFTVLMGWVRALVGSIWALFSSERTTILEFLGRNWLMIALALIAAGLVIDWLIWLLRWQPYHLWAVRMRRLLRLPPPEEDDDEEIDEAIRRGRREQAPARAQAFAPEQELDQELDQGESWLPLERPQLDERDEEQAFAQAESVPDEALGVYPGMRYGTSIQSEPNLGGTQRYAAVHTEGPGAKEVERRRAEIDAWQEQMREEARQKAEAERAAREAYEAEQARLAREAYEAEQARLAQEAYEAEQARLAQEAYEAEQARLAQEAYEAEQARLAQEAYEAEQARLAQEAYEAEQARLAQEAYEAEQARLAQEAYEAEQARLAQEAYEAEQARLAQEEYERQLAEYERQKAQYERDMAEYERKKAAYDAEMARQAAKAAFEAGRTQEDERTPSRRRRAAKATYSDYVAGEPAGELPDPPEWPRFSGKPEIVTPETMTTDETGAKRGTLLSRVARLVEPEQEEIAGVRALPPRVNRHEVYKPPAQPERGVKPGRRRR